MTRVRCADDYWAKLRDDAEFAAEMSEQQASLAFKSYASPPRLGRRWRALAVKASLTCAEVCPHCFAQTPRVCAPARAGGPQR